MTHSVVLPTAEIHELWFGGFNFQPGTTPPTMEAIKRWFVPAPDFDKNCKEHREVVSQIVKLPYDEVVALGKTPDDALTLILLLDQLSRNIGRGTDYPFTTCDPLAVRLAEHFVLKLGYHKSQPPYKRLWFFMPFVHSESLPHQELALSNVANECSELREGDWKEFHEMFKMTLKAVLKHFDAINKFGRFPSRNAVLKRETTPAEAKYLAEGGVF